MGIAVGQISGEEMMSLTGVAIAMTNLADEASADAAWERRQIWALMQRYRANKTRIAQVLGISRGTLYKKIRHYGL
ncbi:helix-turn-helix domain-containing protein [Edwardsiella ictaluri]|uniref:helix-turn-helix domain-containing protein n=1 Tax=Edwardsiella ictaluri TaxID=67780 RepID=UPI001E330914|nr:helix-turn-helix domain-containing protein [Edwardsiella ictaluri]